MEDCKIVCSLMKSIYCNNRKNVQEGSLIQRNMKDQKKKLIIIMIIHFNNKILTNQHPLKERILLILMDLTVITLTN